MEHKGTVKLETDRLILRKATMDDAQDMFDNWASNPNVTKFMTWPTHSNIEITKMVQSNNCLKLYYHFLSMKQIFMLLQEKKGFHIYL